MSESVACALELKDNENTRETRRFIRMIDLFFDCLNVRTPHLSQIKRKDSVAPYKSQTDWRFKVRVLLGFLSRNVIKIVFVTVVGQ